MLLKLPVPEVEKVTVPVGVEAPEPAVSLTEAVQVVATPASTVVGLHDTVVLVLRLFTVTANVPLLEVCVMLPP